MDVREINGQRVIEYPTDGALLASISDVTDLVGEAFATDATVVVVPASQLPAEFFHLRTGFAGEVMQKFQNYGRRLMVVGDISAHVAQSTALRDFVGETNRVGNHFFAPDRDAVEAAI
ncbi:DUF4180 domain-containing protein [Devosia nitrariae]|uniref:DUF4180 domain-containing protein n=1 Tax=Devosia nitrariae TaxID=2071872 RepID=A0ABQ5W5D5_9HYPH|nr:DUF4180 domain-containing protein [Devosia nitrariae]GLQ54871.1 hypothetical protein GCM10010862_21300 [Devosia nitrariae]